MKKIIIIAPPALPVSAKTGGSVEICIYQIGKRLAKYHDITIISRKSKGLPSISKSNRLRIVRIAPGKKYLQRVIKYAKSRRFHCLQVDNRPRFVPILRRYFPSTPIVLVLHSLTFMNYLTRKERQHVIRSASAVIANSHFVKRYYQRQFPRQSGKFHAIHLGVDLSRFRKPKEHERARELARYSLGKSYNILYAGRIIPRKGIDVLVKAAGLVRRKYPYVKLVLVGPCMTRKYKAHLLREAKKANVPIRFIGKVNPSHVHRAYWLGNCFVCPTQFAEGFGLVNIEAMASELPVIASRRGGIVEVLNKRNGILIADYKNPAAFAKAISKLISSPRLSRSLAKSGRKTALLRFGWNRVAREYGRFYAKIV